MAATTEKLPMIMRYLGTSDAGEFGAAKCPHCGADGRYIRSFITADGKRRGAMAGCIKLFPVHPFAEAGMRVAEKIRDAEANGRKPASWDLAIEAALEAYFDQDLTETECESAIRNAEWNKRQWMDRRTGGRRRR
jgi:hypothetical protein